MVRAPVDVIMDVNAALNRRDVAGMLVHYAPSATVRDHRAVPFGDFSGHTELHGLYAGLVGLASEFTEQLEFLAIEGERLVAHCEVSARLVDDPTGRIIGAEYGYIAVIRDDLVQSLDIYDDGAGALEASGLRRA